MSAINIGNITNATFKVGGADCSIYLGSIKLYPQEEPTPSYPYAFERISRGGSAYTFQCDSTSAQTVTSAQTKSGLTTEQLTSTTATETPVSVTFGDCCKRIGSSACSGWTQLTSVTINNSVTSIEWGAFYKCTSLTSVTISDSVTSIGNNAFSGCTSLTSIDIPNSVASIGSSTFSRCTSLTSVTISDSVTSIGSSTFNGCSNLASIIINATTPPTLGSYVFNDTNDCSIYVPAESVEAYKSASGWNTYASRIQAIQ